MIRYEDTVVFIEGIDQIDRPDFRVGQSVWITRNKQSQDETWPVLIKIRKIEGGWIYGNGKKVRARNCFHFKDHAWQDMIDSMVYRLKDLMEYQLHDKQQTHIPYPTPRYKGERK